MLRKIRSKFDRIFKNVTPAERISVLTILILALFVRIYRINDLLGFYYDQGRDALVVWDFIYKGKLFLIGPTTGIEGIFRGPWYYFLITPFYWLGKGNPVYPSIFLSLTTVIAVYVLYILAKEVGGKWAGITSLVIGSFSFSVVMASRWLSNPTPMFLISMVFVYSLFRLIDGKKWAWIMSFLMMGMAMQFGSAAEIFYIPTFLIVIFLNRKNLPGLKTGLVSLFSLLIAFVPQIIFDLRHNWILTKAVFDFLFKASSFKISFWEILNNRLTFYLQTFSDPLFNQGYSYLWLLVPFILTGLYFTNKTFWKNKKLISILILFFFPLVGMLFFQGNEGNVYSYYFTGYIFVFILLLSLILGRITTNFRGKLIVTCLLIGFLFINIKGIFGYLSTNSSESKDIVLENQLDAIDWIYTDNISQEFNVDVYVPPVIPYAYDYLFLWQGSYKYQYLPSENNQNTLYTIYEYDFYLPKRHQDWLVRQDTIGKVIKEERFGNVFVQKRERL